MSIDNTTYNFCIESLRYIHKILGYDTIIQELNFIKHLHSPPKSEVVTEYNINVMQNTYDVTENSSESDTTETKNIIIENKNENKNIIIESKNNKYVRTELPDEKRCETILPTGKRCTFKKADNSVQCSRHTK